jgi:hypothetical protein
MARLSIATEFTVAIDLEHQSNVERNCPSPLREALGINVKM